MIYNKNVRYFSKTVFWRILRNNFGIALELVFISE